MVTRVFDRDSLFAIIAGPMVWVVHFLVLYLTTAIVCARGLFETELMGVRLVPLVGGAATLIALALIGDGLYLSVRRWRRRSDAADDQPGEESRNRFLAFSGTLLSGVALIATVWQALPILFITSCR